MFTSQSGSTNCGVLASEVGYQAAYIGSAYAEIITEGGSDQGCIYREYLYQKLNQPLVGGMTYTVKAYVSLAEGAKKATPIQIALFDGFNLTNFTPNSAWCPNVSIPSSLIKATSGTITDKTAWTEVSGTFTASTTNPEQ